MNEPEILYLALFLTEERIPPPSGLMCDEVTLGSPRTVLYNRIRERWEYNPSSGAKFLFDMELQERTQEVSRVEAERIARDLLGTQLPSEAELHQMLLAGEAAREG